jgi:hypothetical protein
MKAAINAVESVNVQLVEVEFLRRHAALAP